MQHYVIKFVSDLRQVGGFLPGTPVFSTNKTDLHNIAKILLKVASNTTNHHQTVLILKYWHENLSVVTWHCTFYVLQFDLIHTSLNKVSLGICCIYCWRNRFDWDEERNFMTREDFNFPTVNFPFICSNAPAAHAYEVYIPQEIWYSRACGFYQDFLNRGLLLTRKILKLGLLLVKLKSSLLKFYGHHYDFVDRYGIFVAQKTTDMFYLS